MHGSDVFLYAIVLSMVISCSNDRAHAEGIDCLWVSDASVCQKVFEKNGNRISFAKMQISTETDSLSKETRSGEELRRAS